MLEIPKTGTLVNNEDTDEVSQDVAFYQGQHLLLRSKQWSWTDLEIHINLEIRNATP